MNQELLQTLTALAALSSVLSTSCAGYTVWRADKWRKEGAGKKTVKAIDAAHEKADEALRTARSWHESEQATKLRTAIDSNAGRIRSIEDRLEVMATKTDVARIEGSIEGVSREVRSAVAGIDRIEGYFLEIAIKNTGRRESAS